MRLSIALFLLAIPSRLAFAEGEPPAEGTDPDTPAQIAARVASGAALPWTHAAARPGTGVLVGTYGGYDASTRAPVLHGVIEATVVERITLRAAASNYGMSESLRPSAGVVIDVLREASSGVDLAVGSEYEATGWNRVPAVVARAAIARTMGKTRLIGNVALGVGLTDDELYGDVRAAALRAFGAGIFAGLDARARLDLERDDDEPDGEPDWDVQAGPVITYVIGRVAISAAAGLSAWKLRAGGPTRAGALGALGFGAWF
jgi:hypothetical protein